MENKEEVWVDIPLYKDVYQVSSLGRIKTLSREVKIKTGVRCMTEKIRKNGLCCGYLQCMLSFNGIKAQMLVHRIVAEAFIPNPENKRTVNHKNGIKTDNRVENLEWATQKENIRHSIKSGFTKVKTGSDSYWYNKKGENHPRFGLKSKVPCGGNHYKAKIVLNKETGIFYDTIGDASESIGLTRAGLSKMLNNVRKNKTNMILV